MFSLILISNQLKSVTTLMGNIVLNQREQEYLFGLINKGDPFYLKNLVAFFKKSKELLPQRSDLTLKVLDPCFSLDLIGKEEYIGALSPYSMYILLEYDYLANDLFDLVIIPLIKQEKTAKNIDKMLNKIINSFNVSTLPHGIGRSSARRCLLVIIEKSIKLQECEEMGKQKAPIGLYTFYDKNMPFVGGGCDKDNGVLSDILNKNIFSKKLGFYLCLLLVWNTLQI